LFAQGRVSSAKLLASAGNSKFQAPNSKLNKKTGCQQQLFIPFLPKISNKKTK